MDVLRDLWGPGLFFLALVVWLVRKAWKAARTEGELEHERDAAILEALREQARAEAVSRPRPVEDGQPDPLAGADTAHARAEHVALVAQTLAGEPARPIHVVWVRSLGAHVAWLERGLAGAHALRVVRVEAGAAAERWTFE